MARAGRPRKPGSREPSGRPQRDHVNMMPDHGVRSVYVFEAAGNCCKVGLSGFVGKRVADCQTANPFTLRVFWAAQMSVDEAWRIEQHFHRRYRASPQHIRGEWYRMTAQRAAAILADMAAELGILLRPDPAHCATLERLAA